ncbi:DNA-binding protein YbaB [Actinoplanes lutulentus]|uniref:YbaB/EbfC DNA-binding family protein n=1 Tax=Actinoplanes lutulentus TaxID=1287878 RepID=A0A327ZF42_9ACTN|nr:YbaB/EbfC family nucleoid-associated protein [Actinoplanes lutulentus]MBB2941905.1 DNA-binding protein YbaB [Actinoplanes lutulentus]RAK39822.1 YbaB/EbfC DNA-binding family protein [Actinoplanes lutulentus]
MSDFALDDADRWVGDWQAGLEERLARTRALSTRLHALTGSAQSAGGLVEATVDSAGALTDLYLSDEVRRHSARWIAEQILTASEAARAELARQAVLVARANGDDETAEGRVLLTAFTDRLETRR